jgi:hypothetical protein
MSTRRGGKKKVQQQKQQTIPSSSTAAAAAAETLDEDLPRPAFAHATPASPVVVMQQLASKAITPVVRTAAKAITTAVALAMPAIAEGGQPASGIAAAQLDSDQPGSPGPSTGTQQPAFAMTAQKLFADSHPDRRAVAEPADAQEQHDSPEQQEPHSSSGNDDNVCDQQEQPAAGAAAAEASKQLRMAVQRLCSSWSGWKGVLLLCALLLVPVLVTVRSQAHALQAQQELVLAQAHALANLQQELALTSAQLPSLLQTAHATNSSLSSLSTEQGTLLHSLAELSALTQRLQQELGHLNSTHEAGQHAWELLTSVAALNCSVGGASDSGACAATNHSTASIHNASAALKAIMQQSLQQAAQQKDAQARDQAQQQQLLQALPQSIKRAVQQQLSAQAPLPDVALADCGARIVSFTAIDASILRQLGGSAAAAGGAQHVSIWGPRSILQHLQQLQASLLPRNQPTAPLAGAAPGAVAASQGVVAGWSQREQQLLLHRVMLRPASSLQPVSCIPFVHGVHGSPAVVEVQLPQSAYIHSVAVHREAPSVPGVNESTGAGEQPGMLGQISVALVNSSSCGGQAVTCARTPAAAAADADVAVSADSATSADSSRAVGVLSPGVASAVFTHDGSFSSGRAVVSVARTGADGQLSGAVLADRVLVMVESKEGVSGTCVGRVSVYGRPSDPAAFC